MSPSAYRFEIDGIDRHAWESLLSDFEDASLYQTWAFCGDSYRMRTVSHIIMKSEDEVIGCCQLRLLRFPYLRTGVAEANWGPLHMKKGRPFNREALAALIRAIKSEYAVRRGYMLRISSNATGERREVVKKILEDEGFHENTIGRPYRTFRIDLAPSLEELRLNLSQEWRRCLTKAEKNNLSGLEGSDDELFRKYIGLAEEMCDRKKIDMGLNYHQYPRIQKDLPEAMKMRILVCESEGQPRSAIICSAIGDTGIYHLGATGNAGMKLYGSYLLHWRMIQWLKEKGIRYYDLGAFNPRLNPGVYQFKKGLAGKRDCEAVFLSAYDGFFTWRSQFAKAMVVRQYVRSWLEALEFRQSSRGKR
jgi:hypothetical protein